MQVKPNFSGKWRLVLEPGAPPPPAPPGLPTPDLTITQTADTLVAEQPGVRGGSTVSITYKLDGTETKQTINRVDCTITATWKGDSLVTTVTGSAVNFQDTWHMVGAQLVIDTAVPGRTLTQKRTYERM
jgi:hypothetical protein